MTAIRIDVAALPQRALFDTGVVVRALGERPGDPRQPLCEALWEAMLANDRQILIAAPTVAEMIRQHGKGQAPRRKGVEVVAFDRPAAELLGHALPQAVLKGQQQSTGLPFNYIKYDALLLACAARHRATQVVCMDGQMHGMAALLGLTAKKPEDFLAPPSLFDGVE